MKSLASSGRWAFFSDLLRASQMVWDAHAGYTLLVGLLTILQGVLPAAQLWISKLLIDAVAFALQPGAEASPPGEVSKVTNE